MACKLAVIGVDGITYEVINFLIKKGKLPYFKKLLEEGTFANLGSAPSFQSGPCWSSFATGKHPGKHGIFEWIKPLYKYDKVKVVDSRDIESVTFYEILAKKKNICIINLPLSWPPRINGTMITSYSTKGNDFVFPSSLKDKYDFSNYKLRLSDADQIFNVADKVNSMIDSRIDIWKKLAMGDYDFIYILFEMIDTIQHSYYHIIFDEDNKDVKRAWEAYEKVDSFLGWLFKNLPKTNFMIISDHGFKAYNGFFYVNEFLRRNGYLKSSKTRQIKIYKGGNNFIVKLLNNNYILRKFFQKMFFLLDPLIPFKSNVKCRIECHLSDCIDLNKSKAFFPSNEVVGIYVNDKRFYNVVSSKDYDSVRDGIISSINKSGYLKAVKREEVYHGKNLSHAPDIHLFRKDYHTSRALGPQFIKNEKTNAHYGPGIFVLHGPDFVNNKRLSDISIIDLAPTILYFFDEAIPNDMDGKPLIDIFSENSKHKNKKPRYIKSNDFKETNKI